VKIMTQNLRLKWNLYLLRSRSRSMAKKKKRPLMNLSRRTKRHSQETDGYSKPLMSGRNWKLNV